MKKGIFALFAVLFVCFFLLCACEISDETSYSCATSENGKPTVYSLTFTGETGISLTRTTSDTSVTYSGTYTLVSKDIYRVALTSASDNSAVPSRLKEITITLDGSSFSIRYNDATPTETHTVPATIESKPADPSDESSTEPTPSIQPDEQSATPTEKDPPVPTNDQTVGNPEQPIGEDPVASTPSEPNEQETPALPEQTGKNPSEPEPTTPETPTNPQTPVPEEETPTTDPVSNPVDDPTDPMENPRNPEPSDPAEPNIDGEYMRVNDYSFYENTDLTYCCESTTTQKLTLSNKTYTLTETTVTLEVYQINGRYEDDYLTIIFLDGKTDPIQAPDAPEYGFEKVSKKKYIKVSDGKTECIELTSGNNNQYIGTYTVETSRESISSQNTFSYQEETTTVTTESGSFLLSINDKSFSVVQ